MRPLVPTPDPGSGTNPPASLRVRLQYWSVVLAWMAVVSYLSTDAFSAENTHRYIDPVLRFLFPGISNATLLAAHTLLRKAAHFLEFAVLSALAYWAFRGGRPILWSRRWMLRAFLLSSFYAAFDEIHQAFTASRTPSPFDSGIDIAGAAAGQLITYWRCALRAGR